MSLRSLAARPRDDRSSPSATGRPHIGPLDGLRGLAVVGVLLFHAGYLRGGFLGVDLFFVLSGYLITGLLLGETRRRGRVGLAAFWERRTRRLLPALLLLVIVTLPAAWAFASPAVLRFALDDTPWVAAQAVNWHFIAEHVGYWDASGTRLFSHLWSIAVEWQFYLVWPLVVMVAARGRGGERRVGCEQRVAVLAFGGAAVSLALMVVLADPVDTTRVYEGSDTRAFALLLGAGAATAPVRDLLARVSRPSADALCAVLACGLVASWALTDGQNAPGLFQGGMFAHSLVSAGLIALVAVAPGGYTGRVLGSTVPRRLGEISYGVYLWHWPVYVLAPSKVLGLGGSGRTAVLIGVTLVAATLSKILVEDPVRFQVGWAAGRRGLLALAAAAGAAAALWAAIPPPDLGEGTVDIERLMSQQTTP